jgi:hypothetical protein
MSYNGYRKGRSAGSVVIVLLLLLLVAGGVFFVTKEYYDRMETVRYIEQSPTVVEVKTVVSGEVMQDNLRGIGELATEEYTYTEVGSYDSRRSVEIFGQNIGIPLTRASFIYSYDGAIKAGIDFAGVTVEKDETLKCITVSLPKAKILSSELYTDSFRLYDENNNIFNPIGVEAVTETNRVLKETAESRAVDKGLLTRADEHARALIRSLLESSYDINEYDIRIQTVD